MTSRFSLLFLLAAIVAPSIGWAQDQYGSAVGVAGHDVLVLKPAAGQGPATLFVYSKVGNEWEVSHRLMPANGRNSGESFSPSVAVVDSRVFIGGGDPGVALAAHEFARSTGGWESGVRLPLEAAPRGPAEPQQLDMAGLMRIMQPPRRTIAVSGDHLVVGVLGGAAGTNGVRVTSKHSTGEWQPSRPLTVEGVGAGEMFGASVDIDGDRIAIGAPRYNQGAVFVFQRSGDGVWSEGAQLTSQDVASAGFGSSVFLTQNMLFVGAPGSRDTAGVVVAFEFGEATNNWAQVGVLRATDGHAADGFGAALSGSNDTLWVGAPGANESGKVYGYQRNSAGAWASRDVLSGISSGTAFGSSIASTDELLVVGAPGADGGKGRAAVFEPGPNGWGGPVWLSASRDFETVAGSEVVCDAGTAAGFDCGNVDLLAFLPIAALGGDPTEGVSDLWGWTDPVTNREYALVGRNGGVAFVDVTDPISPTYLGELAAPRSGARDLKVYNDHLFFTGDGAGNHGLLIFDLNRLRVVNAPPVQFTVDAKYDGIASAHNLVIDTDAGFAYPVGASAGGETCGGGLHMVDIRDPLNPMFAGCYTDTEGLIWPGRTHDAQCVVYRGPDVNYQGQQICFASNETALRIVDVTEKANPVPIAAATYPGLSYVHQGWLTDDQRYFYLDDELDELVGQASRTRTMVWDVAELDDPVLVGEYFGPDGATDHNLYVKGNRMYQANYQAGMRVVDISDPESPVEIGFFDTTPYDGNPPGFNGAWTVYPFFESGTVVVTSMGEGLFLLRPRPATLVP